jgi:hypothetical protein
MVDLHNGMKRKTKSCKHAMEMKLQPSTSQISHTSGNYTTAAIDAIYINYSPSKTKGFYYSVYLEFSLLKQENKVKTNNSYSCCYSAFRSFMSSSLVLYNDVTSTINDAYRLSKSQNT